MIRPWFLSAVFQRTVDHIIVKMSICQGVLFVHCTCGTFLIKNWRRLWQIMWNFFLFFFLEMHLFSSPKFPFYFIFSVKGFRLPDPANNFFFFLSSCSDHTEGRREGMKTEENQQSCQQQPPSSTPFGKTSKPRINRISCRRKVHSKERCNWHNK